MENSYINPNPQQDLLSDLVIYYVFVFVLVVILATAGIRGIFTPTHNTVVDTLIALVYYGVFMFIYEAIFKGKTLGKVITHTRAVNEDGSPISFKTAFLRGLSRAVPFEAFTAFGDPSYPWHDRWSRSYVIDESRAIISA